ncbi:Nonribosomal peptide synthetase 14 protein [Rutstroemia sp. NJR-2017a BBW]|nr:Nonribosomal peptide synthetase 14 protein [Rutstroemia sp. NJR-2017a BBW]
METLWPPKEDSIEICIRQLSDLNARLYPVYKASCSFAEAQKSHSGALFSAATFHILTTLLEESTPLQQKCNAISETFNASRSLLNIVHQLQATSASSKRMHDYAANSQSQSPASIRTMLDSQRSESSDTSESSGPSSMGSPVAMDGIAERGSHNLVIGYSILACYARLLHIYHTLITALHYDASHAKGIESIPSPSLAELRLILVVQLISHLLNGLREAVAAYFSHVDDPLDPSVLLANQASLKTVSNLEVDIQDKIKQLSEVLRG